MYCPRCAAQNLDNAKFCRGCGTNLEPVALALTGDLPVAESWLQQRRDAISGLIRGVSLLTSSLLVGAALGIFSNLNDWIIVWMVFAGWLAVWGVFAIANGLTGLLNSKYARLQSELSPSRTTAELMGGIPLQSLPAPPSVAEQTTRSLADDRGNVNQN